MNKQDLASGVQEVSARDLLEALSLKRWIILGSIAVMAALGAVVATLMTPVYKAEVVMIPANERSDLSASLGASLGALSGLAAVAGVNIGTSSAETEEAIAVLRSREFSDRFIADKGLAAKFFYKHWDADAQSWLPPGKEPTPSKAFKYFDKRVRSVIEHRKTALVSLQIYWRDPLEAANWANELVGRLNDEMRRRAVEAADGSIAYLERELARSAHLETRNAISRLIEAQMNRRMLAAVSDQFAFRVVDQAVPADIDDVVRPNKAAIVFFSALLGGVGSVSVVALIAAHKRAKD